MAAQIGTDRWGIWRSRDRRTRQIGVMTGAEIDILRIRGWVQPLGDEAPPVLVCGPSLLEKPLAAPSAKRLKQDQRAQSEPLIERMLERCPDRALRQLICETAQHYRADVTCASRLGTVAGMNWDGLALGGRIDGGHGRKSPNGSIAASLAQSRLTIIHSELGSERICFLDRLILGEETQSSLARRFGVRSSLVEGQALAAIRALHQVYKTRVKLPG
ncbi:MAG: hypothetical protein HRT82_07555 [Henriciella sp.]|nr:hypothetical protein [Henriciella sp.]